MLKVRTSTKLLIFIVFCTLLSPVIFNYLMKREFKKGNFYFLHRQKTYIETYSIKDLPSFKHVVIDGMLRGHNGKVVTENIIYWRPRILITDEKDGLSKIEVPIFIADNTSFLVKHDTLYVRFNTKEPFDRFHELRSVFMLSYIKIKAPHLSSLAGVNAGIYLKGVFARADIDLSHSLLSLNKANIQQLSIQADDGCKVKVDRFSEIGHLDYSFCNSAAFIAKGSVAGSTALKVDALSKITVIDSLGNATIMQK